MKNNRFIDIIKRTLGIGVLLPILFVGFICYIHAMGVTFARIRGFVCGLILGCGIAVTIRYLYRHKTTNSA